MRKVKTETDDVYFLKLLIYLVLGLVWVKHDGLRIFPLGLVIGLIIAQKDHFAIDRKIEYAVLLCATVAGVLGYGLFIAI